VEGTEVFFQDLSQDGTSLPEPKFIALHAAVSHVLHSSGAAKVLDSIYDVYSEYSSVLSSEQSHLEETTLKLALMQLTSDSHQLPTNSHVLESHQE
jgi:hypothetical protein